ncbi:RNA-guided endonuclease InsQ/TnpB family protein [Paucibacter soli]|uniref:RNA-guided endonuclease InsQ/TnpB family protein n=1 Tax=Paucibacter soli TaxID=3133433 RepID=UPI00309676D5
MFIEPDSRTRGEVASAPLAAARAPKTPVRVRVLRFRLKDCCAPWLNAAAREVNLVWNYCNELSQKVFERERRFMTGFDLQAYLNGASKAGLSIGSPVFQQVAEEYATRRRQHKKVRLAWRKSGGARRSLGWVPFKARAVDYRAGQIRFNGQSFGLWDSHGLAGYLAAGAKLRGGTFSEDSRGRWFLNVAIEIPELCGPRPHVESEIGVDLGLKELMTDSNGQKIQAQRFYRDLEPALAVAQRAGKKDRAKAIHAKIGNRRKDFLHKLSTDLVRQNRSIFVGNVNAAALAKTSMDKSVLDAGWSKFRTMLQYKCDDAGVWFQEVNESFSTVTCSACGARSGPTGQTGLSVRSWTCGCGATHDRDVNAARNILLAGLAARREKEQPAPGLRAEAIQRVAARVSNKTGLSPTGVGHGPLAEGIPRL